MRGMTDALKQKIARREIIIFGCVHEMRSGTVIEAYRDSACDAIFIDREHTSFSDETVVEHIRLARALELPVMVRAADFSYHQIARALDQAPDGIWAPRIRSAQDARLVIETAKYPPLGRRGLGGSTCPVGRYTGWAHVRQQVEYVNRDVVVGIQIETAEALENLEDILAVPGIDMAVVGNDDLSIGLGVTGELGEPRYIAAVERVIAACKRHDVLPGIAGGDAAFVRFWLDRGMRVFWAASDVVAMWQGLQSQLTRVAETVRAFGAEGGKA